MVVNSFPLLRLEHKVIRRVLNMMRAYQKLVLSLCSLKTKNLIKSQCLRTETLAICGPILKLTNSEEQIMKLGFLVFSNFFSENNWIMFAAIARFEWWDYIRHIVDIFNIQLVSIEFVSDQDEFILCSLKEAIKPLRVLGLKPSPACSNDFTLKVLREFRRAEKIEMTRNPYEEKISIRKIWMSNYHVLCASNDCSLFLNDLLVSNALNIYTTGTCLTEHNVNQFLKLWIAGSNPRLESLMVFYLHVMMIDRNQILKGIDHLVVELTKERVHRRTDSLNEGYSRYKGGYDIRRRDGTLGTIFLNSSVPAAFTFVVWHPYMNN